MSPNEPSETTNARPFEEHPVEGIRKRPSMYIGSTGFFGFINYLVCPVALSLSHRPTKVAVGMRDGAYVVHSNAALPIEKMPNGLLAPFEEFENYGPGHGYEGTVLNALSTSLEAVVVHAGRKEKLAFRRGSRESHQVNSADSHESSTTLTFVPDTSIFSVTNVSPAILRSYLRRLSFLHRGVRFSLGFGNESEEFFAEYGIADLFASVSAPYQILHEPIHIVAEEDTLQLEAIFAFQSWRGNCLWCFMNYGRAVEGGTHEQGFDDGLDKLYRALDLPKTTRGSKASKALRNGVVGVVSIQYPGAVWQGCIKERIGNPELREMVGRLVLDNSLQWVERHPEVAKVLKQIQVFQFPDAWKI